MTSETPAIVATLVLALVLLGVSAPFTFLWWGEGTTEYEVEWEQAQENQTTARLTSAPQTQEARVGVEDRFVSEVRLVAQDCVNTAGLGAGTATVTWALRVDHANGTTEDLGSGQVACPLQGPIVIPVHPRHPDLAAREVDSGDDDVERAAARAGVWDADLVGSLNETSEYVLTLTAARGAGTLPPQLQQPSTLSVALEMQVWRWEALVQEAGDDVAVR